MEFPAFAMTLRGLLIAASLSAAVFAADFGDVSVRIEVVLGGENGRNRSEATEYRAIIVNRSPARSHRVTVILRGANIVQRAVEVAPASSATLSLISTQPLYNDALVEIDGDRKEDGVEIDRSRINAWTKSAKNEYFLLVCGELDRRGLMTEPEVIEGLKNAGGDSEIAYLKYQFPPREWSLNWMSYTGFDVVMLTAEEFAAMPEELRLTLLRYVESGGSLFMVGDWNPPAPWLGRRAILRDDGSFENVIDEQRTISGDQVRVCYIGFGQICATGSRDPRRFPKPLWQAIKDDWRSSPAGKSYWMVNDLNNDFPVADQFGVPVRGLFALMLLFVIVIGPLNLFWLGMRKKRIHMLWTVPAIAVLACLAVAGFALFREGLAATFRTEAFTILDERAHRATTIGWMGFYTAVTPGEGLHFSSEAMVDPLIPESMNYRGGDQYRVIDLTNDTHLASGWVASRIPAFFKLRKSETRRERLTLRAEANGAVIVVNGLGAELRQLWYADRNGKLHSATAIAAGAQARLTPAGDPAGDRPRALRDLFANADWLSGLKTIESRPAQALLPGSYLALVDRSPFLEEPLAGIEARRGRSFIYGISAEGK
ncbi:MAG: hypothetical protein ACKVX9_20475 [Blastocatellia bacterium]